MSKSTSFIRNSVNGTSLEITLGRDPVGQYRPDSPQAATRKTLPSWSMERENIYADRKAGQRNAKTK